VAEKRAAFAGKFLVPASRATGAVTGSPHECASIFLPGDGGSDSCVQNGTAGRDPAQSLSLPDGITDFRDLLAMTCDVQ
jgi:hypothetical protein